MTKHTRTKEHTIRCSNGCDKRLRLTRTQAVKCFCVECLGFDTEPSKCVCVKCPLYPFRGKTLLNKIGDIKVGRRRNE
ncbi:MAG: hypothetical protein WC455_27385 [Dehalococcoidia bacterium]